MAESDIPFLRGVVTCDEAKASGQTTYYNGRPCRRGHIAPRQTNNRTCVECKRISDKKWVSSHPEHVLAYRATWNENNRDVKAAKNTAWAKANPDKVALIKRRHADKPESREANRIASQRIRERNPGKATAWKQANPERARVHSNAYAMRRYASKTNSTPAWADLAAIKAIYAECARITKTTGIKHHVDHFYPLRGKFVSGLHVAANLRIIPASENVKKGNRMPVDIAA